jgi:glycosyltransferase involved in cell wall biosynthesis
VRRSVLFVGQAYYNHWYLSRRLRELGWKADLVNIDAGHGGHYHGQDLQLVGGKRRDLAKQAAFFAKAVREYDVFHFANAHGLRFGDAVHDFAAHRFHDYDEIRLLKRLGKKVVYTNNGCLDGVAQSSYRAWGPYPTCDDCPFQSRPDVCSDDQNLAWGKARNELADYVALLGGNRVDYNVAPNVHENPWIYCLDEDVWQPDLLVPSNFRLGLREETFKIYHSVGNADTRSQAGSMRNTKSTHIYLPLVDDLKAEGRDVELLFFKDVPNRELRYYQAQADVFVDMLTAGFFGATAREGMMLGKPVVTFLRPEWLEQMRREVPAYADELPVISATPDTIRAILIDLMDHPEQRLEIGRRSREFAVKWHGSREAARVWDGIYRSLLDGTLEPAPWGAVGSPQPDLASLTS